jgi:hypothetical protein
VLFQSGAYAGGAERVILIASHSRTLNRLRQEALRALRQQYLGMDLSVARVHERGNVCARTSFLLAPIRAGVMRCASPHRYGDRGCPQSRM